jgi:hypothetical protein
LQSDQNGPIPSTSGVSVPAPTTSQAVTEDVTSNQAATSVCPTSASSNSNIFVCQESFFNYLTQHLKSKTAMKDLAAGSYSVEARRSIMQVAVSKMVDTYGITPQLKLKQECPRSWLQ